MVRDRDIMQRIGRLAAEVVAETLWPTRCVLCDAPGSVLCEPCAAQLPYLDWWNACHRCGSAYGRIQCDLCNPVMLERIGRKALPFSSCACAMSFSDESGTIVRAYKDQGERRLASVMAALMARVIVPEWRFDVLTYIPATKAAVRYRGFDHAELLANEVAARVGVPCAGLLARPKALDQRALTGRQRIANLNGRFHALDSAPSGVRLLLVDDVFTTGATMCAASDALINAGADCVYGLVFARV